MLSEHKKQIFVLMLLGIFLVPTISADLVFQQSTIVDIKIVCINAGYCSSSSICNVSVFNPEELTLLDGIQTTRASNLAFHNFTLNSTHTNTLGEYRVAGFCKDGSVTQLIDFTFDITADGKPLQVFPTQFGVILFSFFLIIFGLSKERFRMFKHIGSILLMIMGVITLYPGYAFINWTTLLGKSVGSSLIGLGFYFLIEDSFSRSDQEESYDQEQEGVDSE